jgi:hypothetical protein
MLGWGDTGPDPAYLLHSPRGVGKGFGGED